MNTYSIVLPIKVKKDREYTSNFILFTQIGIKTYEKFLDTKNLDYFYIICPAEEIPEITPYLQNSKIPYKIVSDNSVIKSDCEGWYKQQLIKLGMSFQIKSKYYLVLDSDHYLTQNFSFDNMFYNDKIKYSYEPWQTENSYKYSVNSKWWEQSCEILKFSIGDIKTEKELMGVTPQLLVTNIVIDLLKSLLDWEDLLLKNKFTEFTLYWLYILQTKQKNLYTIEGYPLWKHDLNYNLLYYHQNETVVRNSFSTPISYFSVIQGYLCSNPIPFIKEAEKHIGKTYDAIFLVASMLNPNKYQAFSVQERFQQCMNTFNSARRYVPNSLVINIEGSVIPDYLKNEYYKHFDYILELGNDSEVIPFVNNKHNIGHGEMKLLEKGIDYLIKHVLNKHKTKYIFKLGARYELNQNFKLTNFDPNKYGFREHIDDSIKLPVFTTGLYSIPVNEIKEFKEILIKSQNVLTVKCPMIERLFLEMIPDDKIHRVKTLGLEGMLSYNKHFFSV